MAEIERRAGDPRFVQVLFPAGGQEPFGSRKYWPIYEAAAAHGLPVAYHTGGYSGHRGTGWPSFYLEEHTAYGVVDADGAHEPASAQGAFAAIPGAARSCSPRAARSGRRRCAGGSTRRGRSCATRRRSSNGCRRSTSTSTSGTTPSRWRSPTIPAHFLQVVEHARLEDRLMFATDYPHWDFDSPTQALPRGMSKELRGERAGRQRLRPLRPAEGARCRLTPQPAGRDRLRRPLRAGVDGRR